MNTVQALQALAAGQKITLPRNPEDYIYVDEDGDLVDDQGQLSAFASDNDDVWSLWVAPNPHVEGTFAWAREEARRGKIVQVSTPFGNAVADNSGFGPGSFFNMAQFDATNWTVQGA